ncbi:Ltp family lipoprotein [Actinoplanes lobatus]|uniref:Putative host cell surface-exposed lipoprotein Ltp-like HTH region domain-containing protein n=1 Tax=Actinoplanes lobatus TaxID=113568 RepID=A0A7W7HK28_9ACTN|nr:Ltp family lipoprotein [Actinoplanes lobatus]MBB4751993.1 hypothetical protein [Actinoplanes lobatus]GIE45323.1 hypothetical protein Alo02nite_82210 [Actinoplanes lobatus]
MPYAFCSIGARSFGYGCPWDVLSLRIPISRNGVPKIANPFEYPGRQTSEFRARGFAPELEVENQLKFGDALPIVAADGKHYFLLGSKESTVRKILVTVSTAFIALGLVGSPAAAQAATPHATAAVSYSAAKESVAQKNAARMAASYLKYSAFSRSGLIEQLKYEGFSTKLATYGVDAQHANWKKQAAKMAKSYLKYSAFSRQGLIDQLKYEGFTTAQATYGVNQAGL